MFMGEYNHSIDAKGRMIVPAKFREQLGNEFVVTKGLDGCLFVYSNEEWHRIEENLRDKPLTSREARKFMRFLLCCILRQIQLPYLYLRILLSSPVRGFCPACPVNS